jgi:hypothetical protein
MVDELTDGDDDGVEGGVGEGSLWWQILSISKIERDV